jgi:menaquinone-dependent protoporphyrinogen oxidase
MTPQAQRSAQAEREHGPARVLLVYASTHGHTAKVASRIADAIADEHVSVDLRDIVAGGQLDPAGYDGVIVGASIHVGRHQSEIVDWAESHRTTLTIEPSAFFSVCLTAADDTEESRQATRDYLDDFIERQVGRRS